jgi:hypothetical protein
MDKASHVFPPKFAESMQQAAEEMLQDVMQAVNDAPDGDWISGSEEQVRDRFAVFREQMYQTALQARIDAAEAAFSPSGDGSDRPGYRAAGDEAEAE